MPTVFREGPYRFFFYAGDGQEPVHIHVERDDDSARFWLVPVRLHHSEGFRRAELSRIKRIIEENQEYIARFWNEYFAD
jgi:hypothetical protein